MRRSLACTGGSGSLWGYNPRVAVTREGKGDLPSLFSFATNSMAHPPACLMMLHAGDNVGRRAASQAAALTSKDIQVARPLDPPNGQSFGPFLPVGTSSSHRLRARVDEKQ
jgi:hypothetical protein